MARCYPSTRAPLNASCARIPGIGAVTSTASLVRPELVVRPDFARAADLGVTSAAIADVLRIATAGDYDQGIAKLNLAQRQIPIIVKLPPEARQDLSLLGAPDRTRKKRPGDDRPCGQHLRSPAARPRSTATTGCAISISRLNSTSNRSATVEKQALALPSLKNLPRRYPANHGRRCRSDGRTVCQSFSLAMATGVLCIYIVLVLLFKRLSSSR